MIEKTVIRFRVGYFRSDVKPYTVTADNEDQELMCQDDPRFLQWLTPWQQAEVGFVEPPLEAAPEVQPFGYVTQGDVEDYKYYGLEGPVIGPKDETRTVPVYLDAAQVPAKEEQHG